jgi:hypothetical protein
VNRDSCSICRQGGNLILCDNCPKSFHQECLKLKDIPEGEWFCATCIPIIQKRTSFKDVKESKDKEESKRIKNEKRRLYRLKKKEERLQGKFTSDVPQLIFNLLNYFRRKIH